MDQLMGVLRALVPAAVAYAVGAGWIPAGAAADVTALILAFGAAGWSIYTNSRASKVAAVAAMPGTVVSPEGTKITLVERDLAQAAKEAATPASGK